MRRIQVDNEVDEIIKKGEDIDDKTKRVTIDK